MILIPAIDIRGGRAVRLVQGDYEREIEFDVDPLDAANRWVEGGARMLHVVDLDGARDGAPANLHHVERIVKQSRVPVELGGGLRDSVAVGAAFDAGVARVILGTAALTNPELVNALIEAHGAERVIVSIDARAGEATHSGWVEGGGTTPAELARAMVDRGVRGFVYTPIEADGMLEGPVLEGLREVAEAIAESNSELIYSGGIGTTEDLAELAAAAIPGIGGVIVGRALYDGRFTVAEGQAALAG
ncbi:MAG: 1-(5-phosphoribosyl)-5-[(5-phosphoribosylamino)methylideneamino]imidazole-4-carboxamide isomerase [Solirubrobacterales bacterium]